VKLGTTGFPTQATVIGPTPESIDLGTDGSAYVAGHGTPDFAPVNPFQPSGDTAGFAARLNPGGTAYVWASYVAGAMNGIAADPDGNAWVVGTSSSSSFPTKDPTKPKTAPEEAVVVEVSPAGALLFGTFVGGGQGTGVAVDPDGNAYVIGIATADFLTTPGAFETAPTGTQDDVFVVKYGAGVTGMQPVIWTSPVRVAVDGNAITKIAGCEGCADAGAISQQTIAAGDGFVQFTVSSNASLTVGLSAGNPGTTQNEIKFGLRFAPGSVEVRESGVYKADFAPTAGAVYTIAVDGGLVKYFQNGTLKYTSAQAPAYPLLADTAVLTPNTGVQNAMIGGASGSPGGGGGGTPGGGTGSQSVVWTSAVGVAVSGNTITKNAGCTGCADAGAISQQTIPQGDGSVSFTSSPGAQMTVGLSTGNPGTTGSEIKFGLRFFPGYVEVRESGVYKADFPIVPGAVYRIAVDGGAVKYFQGGTLKYTSTRIPAYPLLVDTGLFTAGSAVQNAILGP
jgi:hypothetical protein